MTKTMQFSCNRLVAFLFIIVVGSCFVTVRSFPLSRDGQSGGSSPELNNAWSSPAVIALVAVAIVCTVSIVAMCTCCQDALFSPKGDTSDTIPRRHSMEPPSDSSLSTPRASHSDLAVTIEPLPDIASSKSGKTFTKPMGYNQVVNKGPDVSDWFRADINAPDFPRGQLQYVKELGTGWFGSVVEGEASKMSPQRRKVKVVVQIIGEELTSMERAYLLYTARMFRDVSHENVLKIIGKCVDKQPYLLLYEHCPQGDYLKSYLIARRGVSDDLVHSGTVLKMCCEVADGLVALHQKGFVHSDLACRNCLVSSNGTVKIGDYGTGFSVFKDEYVTVGDIAVPIRWISPDSVEVAASGQLVTKDVKKTDNVWTLGVVVWEILEFGKMPYMELNNDGVVNSVLKNRSTYLQPPMCPVPNRERLYEVMRFCWLPSSSRPSSEQIAALLKHIFHFRPAIDSVDDFDSKWNSLIAAQKAALPANAENADSPVPTDPSVLQDSLVKEAMNTPAEGKATTGNDSATDIFDQREKTEPSNHAPDAFDQQFESPAYSDQPLTEFPIMNTSTPIQAQAPPVVQDSPKMVPEMGDADRERIEKRTFILTLSMADLATMKTNDLVEFYEYLSKEEISDLERRHAQAVEETREAEERRKKRDQFLTMTLDEMSELKTEELDDYMRCLDELDRKETQEKLAAAAIEKQRKKQLEDKRRMVLNFTDPEVSELHEEQLDYFEPCLSVEEFQSFKNRWRNLKQQEELKRKAEELLNLEDRDLVALNMELIEANCAYLDNDQADTLKKKFEKLSNMKLMIMNASGEELVNMSDGEFEHLANILSVDEENEIRRKRMDELERKIINEKKRQAVLALTNLELVNISESDMVTFKDVLAPDEMLALWERRTEVTRARNTILAMDPDTLRSMDNEEFEKYYRYLTPEEIGQLESIRNTVPVIPAISPSVQGSMLVEEALQVAKNDLNEDLDKSIDHNGEERSALETNTSTWRETRQLSASKRDAVPSLNLSSLDSVDIGRPTATPEIRMEHEQQRERILNTTNEELAGMSQEDFEEYFQYLAPEEIFDLEERRRNHVNASVAKNKENGSGLEEVENGNEVEEVENGDAKDRFSGQSAWEARDHVLHMSDSQLAQMKPDDLKQISTYFTSEEFNRIERQWTDACDKLDFLKQSTDEELAMLPTERLEEYLSAAPEEERAQIRERVNGIQTKWLPATLRDEYAFREILKTVPSIALTSESESYHHHPNESFPQKSLDTPTSSVDVEEDMEKLASVNVEESPKQHTIPKSLEEGPLDSYVSPKRGLQIPQVHFQAATPVDDLSPSSEFFPVPKCAPLNLEEEGLTDTPDQTVQEQQTTSTPLYESFAESFMKDIDHSTAPTDPSGYVTAPVDMWDKSNVMQYTDMQQTEEDQKMPKPTVAEGDLLGDFGDFGEADTHAPNGGLHGENVQTNAHPIIHPMNGSDQSNAAENGPKKDTNLMD